jgi:hypothetical protein
MILGQVRAKSRAMLMGWLVDKIIGSWADSYRKSVDETLIEANARASEI